MQLVVLVVDPLQEAPPWAGAGLLHDLDLDFVPLAQVTEQDPQFPQFPQLPSTEMYYNISTVQSSLANVNQGRTQAHVTYKVVAMTTKYRRGRDPMVVGFTATYAISAHQH